MLSISSFFGNFKTLKCIDKLCDKEFHAELWKKKKKKKKEKKTNKFAKVNKSIKDINF